MKIKKLIAIIMTAVIALSWGCSDEPIYDSVPYNGAGGDGLSITATIAGDDALKAGYSSARIAFERYDMNVKLTWEEDDEIHLSFVQDGVAYPGSAKAGNLTNGDMSAEFAFSLPSGVKANKPFDLYGVYGGKGLKDGDASIAVLPDNSNHGDLESLTGDMMLYFTYPGVDLNKNSNINVSFNHIGSLFNITLKNTSAADLTDLKSIGLITASGTSNWAYNGDGKGTFDLTKGEFVGGGGERIAFSVDNKTVKAKGDISVWAWFPILPNPDKEASEKYKKWPEIKVDIKYGASDEKTSTTFRPERTPGVGNAYYLMAEWNGSTLTFTEPPTTSIYFVKTDGDDSNDGTSWATAFKTITKAVATISDDGDEIRVAKGTYKEGEQITLGNKGLILKGGYNTATGEQSYLKADKSILDGENSYRLMNASPAASYVERLRSIDNFIFTNGAEHSGAAFWNRRSRNTIISNSIFRNNNNITYNGEGGAIVNYDGSSVITIVNCLFEGNSSQANGGAIANWDGSTTNIINCTFVGNNAKGTGRNLETYGAGGAIYNLRSTSTVGEVNIYNSIFWRNTARLRGNELSSNNTGTGINGVFNLSNNIIKGGIAGIDKGSGGTVNFANSAEKDAADKNPVFVSDKDFSLSTGSPAINAGNNSKTPAFANTDLNGNPRFKGTVDLGAYEEQTGVISRVNEMSLMFEDTPGEKTLLLQSNQPWTVFASEDWITVSPLNGGTGDNIPIKVSVKKNDDIERVAKLVITPNIGNPIEVEITQKKAANLAPVTRYVAPNAVGNGSGDSKANAADFLNSSFWAGIRTVLDIRSVEVQFLPGDYRKAYTTPGTGGLLLERLGNKDNRLTITGGKDVVFTLPGDHPTTMSNVIRIHGCQNMHFRDFNFTGHGGINYVLAIRTPSGYPPSQNILIENCTWTDMKGIVYGATGCHYEGTINITYKNCTFKRIGASSGAHMMYNAYGPSNINVVDCHFEDCLGDYVRFRDRTEYGMVKNSKFVRTASAPNIPFITIPVFNDVDPGDEYFGTNFAFIDNEFINQASTNTNRAISFTHRGFTPAGYLYLPSLQESQTMRNGTKSQRLNQYKINFGVDLEKVRIRGNSFSSKITTPMSFNVAAAYGAVSRGWTGTLDISGLINTSTTPFAWENNIFMLP